MSLMTVDEAARFLKVTPQTVYKLVKRGVIYGGYHTNAGKMQVMVEKYDVMQYRKSRGKFDDRDDE